MKKLTALLLAGSLSVTLFGCKNKNTGHQEDGDELVSVWLVTSETWYEPDGSKGLRQMNYTYTEKGMPLTEAYDTGPKKEWYDAEEDVYKMSFLPYDGVVDQLFQYHYNDHGDLLYYEETQRVLDDQGNETVTNFYSHDKSPNVYHYDGQGRIESVDMYSFNPDWTVGDEISGVAYFCYDKKGNLFEIYYEDLQEDGKIKWAYDFRYDETGRMICSASHYWTGLYIYEYDYNSDGTIAQIRTYLTQPDQHPLDDQHISQSDYAPPVSADKGEPRYTVRYSYDSKGRLVSRTGVNDAECTYDDAGRLKTVIYFEDDKYVYVDSEEEVGDDATYLVRDKNGNVEKVIYPSGAYMVYTYQEFRLSKEDAARCNAVRLVNSRVDIVGTGVSQWLKFKGSYGFIPYLPIPENDLLFTDMLRDPY